MTTQFDATIETIARRVRAARSAAKLSLDQLAVRAAVSKGSMVKLEQGQGNPSIAVLCQVAAALGVSLADLVSQPEPDQRAVEFDLEGGKILWEGPRGGKGRLIAGTSGTAMVELWDWKLRPTERHDAPAHSKGTREFILVTNGKLGFSLGAWKTTIRAGHGLLATTDLAHAYWCEGSRPVRFQMFVSEWP